MNLKVPGAILPLGCAILSTRAITVRGGWYNPPLGELGLNTLLNTIRACLDAQYANIETRRSCLVALLIRG